jgi:hypothetical protein
MDSSVGRFFSNLLFGNKRQKIEEEDEEEGDEEEEDEDAILPESVFSSRFRLFEPSNYTYTDAEFQGVSIKVRKGEHSSGEKCTIYKLKCTDKDNHDVVYDHYISLPDQNVDESDFAFTPVVPGTEPVKKKWEVFVYPEGTSDENNRIGFGRLYLKPAENNNTGPILALDVQIPKKEHKGKGIGYHLFIVLKLHLARIHVLQSLYRKETKGLDEIGPFDKFGDQFVELKKQYKAAFGSPFPPKIKNIAGHTIDFTKPPSNDEKLTGKMTGEDFWLANWTKDDFKDKMKGILERMYSARVRRRVFGYCLGKFELRQYEANTDVFTNMYTKPPVTGGELRYSSFEHQRFKGFVCTQTNSKEYSIRDTINDKQYTCLIDEYTDLTDNGEDEILELSLKNGNDFLLRVCLVSGNEGSRTEALYTNKEFNKLVDLMLAIVSDYSGAYYDKLKRGMFALKER